MSSIRKQTIISSILVYIGFLIGAINTYFYVREGAFTTEQFGLTRLFFDVGQNVFTFASLGVIPVVYKFYPYYKDNIEDKKNDLLTWALIAATIGFILISLTGIILEPVVTRKFSERSSLFVQYYYWVYPFAFGMLLFSILEGFTWALQKTVVSNFLRETALRIVTSAFILLYYFKLISFQEFVWLFSCIYFFIAAALVIYLIRIGKFTITFSLSRVTKKFRKKMFAMQSLIFGGICIQALGQTIDGILIASLKGLGPTGIFTLAQYAANLIQVPQRSIYTISIGFLSRAWKDKNMEEINRIYQRSCINMLLLSVFIFGNIWLCVEDGLKVLNIQSAYAEALPIIFVLGIARVIDAGTGVNSTIIGTSTFWRFEFMSGVVLLTLRIPLSYILIKNYGITGSAYAELISYTVYNAIRFEFLRRKFSMQPFTVQTVYSLLLGIASFLITYFAFAHLDGWLAIIFRGLMFSGIMVTGIFLFKLTPDAKQLLEVLRKRISNKE